MKKTHHTPPTDYGTRHRAYCRRRTTDAAVIATVSASFIL